MGDLKKITPTRGLHQADPFLPYLFIMCVEGLSSILNKAEQEGNIHKATIMRGVTSVNHLLFADDCIFYSRATKDEWDKILKMLTLYEKGSGQTLNKHKSSIFFIPSTLESDKKQSTQVTWGFICGNYNKYLGLPAFVCHFKSNTFRGLKEKIWKRVHSWTSKFLSQAGLKF